MGSLLEAEERQKFRGVVNNARDKDVISKEEVGFIVTLAERFRADIDKKILLLRRLEGEIAQLKNNEKIIVDLIEHLISAQEREKARVETEKKLKDARDTSGNNSLDEE